MALPGETTAIVGSTGSGKSTLINLIPRFYDATAGSVLVDGVDVRELDREDLWRRIGFVPQKAFLFSGTVASNLRFGDPDATDEELWRALEIAQAADFVREMEGGLEAPITQGGTNVSGGQRQRLAIARALVKRPADLIFDDSFSALDFGTDSRLRAALDREMRSATRDHRRPARRHDHEGRPDPGDGRGPDRRQRHARRAARVERDVSRDRLLAAVRVGGGGVTQQRGPGAPSAGSGPSAGPGPGGRRGGGPGMFGMQLPPAKAKDFKGAFRRLIDRLRPERPLIVIVIVLAVISVAFAVIGPKILGNATNVIFDGRRSASRSRLA